MPDDSPPTERLLTIDEAASYLGIAPSTLQTWVSRRRIPHVRFHEEGAKGRQIVRFRIEGLREWAKEHEVPARPRPGRTQAAPAEAGQE